MRTVWGLAVIGSILLAGAGSAGAQPPGRDGDTWGWRRHQATESQVTQDERAAGVATSPTHEDSDVAALDRIYRQLMGSDRPSA